MPFDDPSVRAEVEVTNRDELAIIDRMLELLATPRQWCQGRETVGYNTFCLVGAFGMAKAGAAVVPHRLIDGDPVWQRLFDLAQYAGGPVAYNDMPGRTHTDIIRLLRTARASFE